MKRKSNTTYFDNTLKDEKWKLYKADCLFYLFISFFKAPAYLWTAWDQCEALSVELSALTPVILSISTSGVFGVNYYNMASYG